MSWDKTMAVVRRVYIYVVSGVSLAMFLVGLGNGGGALIEALTAGSLAATFRQTLALSAALILVGLPVWILHWRKALQLGASDPGERAAALRRLYFFVVTAFLLVAIGALGMRLIEATLEHFDGHRAKTAEALGIGIRTLTNKLRLYGYAPRARTFGKAA